MLQRLARWYDVSVGELVAAAVVIILLAAACGVWVLIDYSAPVRAVVAATGALGLALPPLTRHIVRNPGLRSAASAVVAAIAVGAMLTGLAGDPLFGFGVGTALAVAYRARVWAQRKAMKNDLLRAQRHEAG